MVDLIVVGEVQGGEELWKGVLPEVVGRHNERQALVTHDARACATLHGNELAGPLPAVLVLAVWAPPDVHDGTW